MCPPWGDPRPEWVAVYKIDNLFRAMDVNKIAHAFNGFFWQ